MVNYTKQLDEWEITTVLARQPQPDGPRQERIFTFVIPAVDEESAKRAGIEMAMGINEGSGHQWKLADDEDGPKVRRLDERATVAGMPVFVLKAKDALAVWPIEDYRRECVRHGLIDQAEQVQLAIDEIKAWQAAHWDLVKLPDHKHVPVGEG
jgi:hypothetical protein